MEKLSSGSIMLSDNQFKTIAKLAYDEAGLVLVESKASMIAARLAKRVKTLGLKSFEEYLCFLQSDGKNTELLGFLSALTTNVSHFFREEHHFEFLKQNICSEIKSITSKGGKYRVWSAGCSTGQEIYSILMTFSEELRDLSKIDIKFLATDIDPEVVEYAKTGIYSNSQAKNISESRINAHFLKNEDGDYEISERLKKMVTFRRLNLLTDWPMKSKFDVIFCRNVVIYFDEKTQNDLWRRFSEILNTGGYLFIGHSERIQDPRSYSMEAAGITTYRKI